MKIGGCLVTSTFDIRTDSLEIELYVNIVVHVTILEPENTAIGDSLSQVQFPACQFYLSKFDVMRPYNFHKVLKTSVAELIHTRSTRSCEQRGKPGIGQFLRGSLP